MGSDAGAGDTADSEVVAAETADSARAPSVTGAWDTGAADAVAGAASASDDGVTEVLATDVALGDVSSARAFPAAVRVMTQSPRSSATPRSSRERIRAERTTAHAPSPLRDGIGPPSLFSECPMVFKAVPRSARLTDYSSVLDFGDMGER